MKRLRFIKQLLIKNKVRNKKFINLNILYLNGHVIIQRHNSQNYENFRGQN